MSRLRWTCFPPTCETGLALARAAAHAHRGMPPGAAGAPAAAAAAAAAAAWLSHQQQRTTPFTLPNLPRGHTRNGPMREPGMRYRPDQYDQTACDGLNETATHGRCPPTCEGLGLAGNVCPVVLACSDRNGCSMTPLVGFGYNPTIVRAPEHLRRGGVEFIGTDRFEQNNKSVRAGRGWGALVGGRSC